MVIDLILRISFVMDVGFTKLTNTNCRSHSLRRVYMAEKSFNGIPQHHQKYIPHFLDNLKTIQTCISHNYEIIRLIIKDAEFMFENKTHEADDKVCSGRLCFSGSQNVALCNMYLDSLP
jgi:hypothetical protein